MTEIQKPLMDPFQILSLIIPTVLAVLGWIIAGLWAVKQINMAHGKHRQLEMELLQRNKKDSIYKEFIDVYLKLARSILALSNSLGIVLGNMILEEKFQNSNITSGWQNTIKTLNLASEELVQNMRYLKLWLGVSSACLPNAEPLEEILVQYTRIFTEDNNPPKGSPWFRLQMELAKMKIDNKPNSTAYREGHKVMTKSLGILLKELEERAKEITKHLLE